MLKKSLTFLNLAKHHFRLPKLHIVRNRPIFCFFEKTRLLDAKYEYFLEKLEIELIQKKDISNSVGWYLCDIMDVSDEACFEW